MPNRRAKDDADTWRRRQEEGRQKFLALAQSRYTEGTLVRLLENGAARSRRAALLALGQLGGIDAICMSHPHFYAANVEFADAFGARIFIPRADQQWIQRPSPRIELFDDEAEPVPGLTLARIGGHFDGAAVLHWPAGAQGRGALLTGDTITVVRVDTRTTKVTGQIEDRRAHWTIFSTVVVRMGISISDIAVSHAARGPS